MIDVCGDLVFKGTEHARLYIGSYVDIIELTSMCIGNLD